MHRQRSTIFQRAVEHWARYPRVTYAQWEREYDAGLREVVR